MSTRARDLVDDVQQHVIKCVLRSFTGMDESQESIVDANAEASNSGANVERVATYSEDKETTIAESSDDEVFWPKIKSVLKDTSGVPSCW